MTKLFPVLFVGKSFDMNTNVLGMIFQFLVLSGRIFGILHTQIGVERKL